MRLLKKHRILLAISTIYFCVLFSLIISIITLNTITKQQENLKRLQEDSIFLNDRSIYYTKCVVLLLTQDEPISLERLSTCEFKVETKDGKILKNLKFEPTLNRGLNE